MTQQLFEDLTADAPPSTIDVAGIVRSEKRRRTLVRVGVPVAAIAVLATAFAVISPAAPAPPVTFSAQATAPAPAPGFRLVATNRATRAATAASLRKAMGDAVRATAPDAKWLAQGDPAYSTPDGQPPLITGDGVQRTQDQMFFGGTGISLDGRRGTIRLSVIAVNPCNGGTLSKCGTDPKILNPDTYFKCYPSPEECTESKGTDGRRQRVRTTTSLHGFVGHEATVELADKRTLLVFVDNEFIVPGTDPDNSVAQPEAPLSLLQIGAVATAIGDQILP
ncbi:hypothetical protein BJ973_000440 [Actinoplanes tereljensis]|uniref:Uncharacterized protein n=1 Tax=Paractinoplanes tereljensis TaxID=571912 RepID=A0A919NSK8_9ACTN|nr:hypothetical protein [Actinoplanes tereljensis]GIF23204.1 hypothetical protein Ate02nite_59340 [Actinoplanes tereljensis]